MLEGKIGSRRGGTSRTPIPHASVFC